MDSDIDVGRVGVSQKCAFEIVIFSLVHGIFSEHVLNVRRVKSYDLHKNKTKNQYVLYILSRQYSNID